MRRFLLLAFLLAAGCQGPAGKPKVTVAYSPGLDALCAVVRGGAIKDEWKTELASRRPEFEKSWATLGPRMIDATEAITSKPFPSGDVTARLSLCDLPSQSFVGISINMRRALASFPAATTSGRGKSSTPPTPST